MKKVAVFLHSRELSGASLAILDALRYYNSDEFEIYVVLPLFNKKFIDELQKVNIDRNHIIIGNYIVRYRCLNNNSLSKRVVKFLLEKTVNKISLFILKNRLRKERIELIHSNSFAIYYGALLAKKLKLPHIWHIREFMEKDDLVSHYNTNLVRKLANYSYSIYISDTIKSKYETLYSFKDYKVIYDNVDYDDSYLKKRKFLQDEICNMMFVGLLDTNKNALDSIKCSKKLLDCGIRNNLYICGNVGNQYNVIKEYIETNNLTNVKLLGYRKDVLELRKNIDISFMSSYSEAFGRTTVESQYYENLIIGAVSNKSSSRSLIKHMNTGLLYERGNIDDLCDKVIYAIKNRDKVNNILIEAKKHALKKYNRNILLEIFEYYNQILNREGDNYERKECK